ncbi:MAG: hypothetical protein M3R24_01465 [Chloroflexota bacterium]|nr:hypothetical protein [Chloroflexota bacterium]
MSSPHILDLNHHVLNRRHLLLLGMALRDGRRQFWLFTLRRQLVHLELAPTVHGRAARKATGRALNVPDARPVVGIAERLGRIGL